MKKKKKRTSKLKKKKRRGTFAIFNLGGKNWIVAKDNDSWNH